MAVLPPSSREHEGAPVRVLVVEDHPTLAYAMRELLEADERLIVVDCVATGEAACSHPHLADVDVVLTDVHLPGVDGLTLAGTLRERHPHLRVVVVSGSGDNATRDEAFAHGAFAYIEKGGVTSLLIEQILAAADAAHSSRVS